ncbi:hypothetical protein NDU88_004399 [Pleurodeles waltl]|uniref:Uncharacterized protein n=1 Tax=Pleurodeles waltl TaxID=8319 RepID=A0AAV7NJK5_PLEWA|nr:hypothetical protein NDU88_004399 [Pleurodeles waltl]
MRALTCSRHRVHSHRDSCPGDAGRRRRSRAVSSRCPGNAVNKYAVKTLDESAHVPTSQRALSPGQQPVLRNRATTGTARPSQRLPIGKKKKNKILFSFLIRLWLHVSAFCHRFGTFLLYLIVPSTAPLLSARATMFTVPSNSCLADEKLSFHTAGSR